jgi:predicted PurR-regulated permease PerM
MIQGPPAPGARSVTRKLAGISLLFIGVLGVVLPILHGGIFLALGFFVLRDQYAWARRGMAWMRERWPGATDRVEATEARLIAWFERQGARLRKLLPIG